MTSYDPDVHFTISALSRLEDIGIPVIMALNANIQLLQILVPCTYALTTPTLSTLLSVWLLYSASNCLSPTWRNLLTIIYLLNVDDLAQRMEAYLSGIVMKELYSNKGEVIELA